jgi:TBC1 domain family member 2
VRLWDAYFARGLGIHVYICLALLAHMKEELEEMDQAEIHSRLNRIPWVDIDKIIIDAVAIRSEAIERALANELDEF